MNLPGLYKYPDNHGLLYTHLCLKDEKSEVILFCHTLVVKKNVYNNGLNTCTTQFRPTAILYSNTFAA